MSAGSVTSIVEARHRDRSFDELLAPGADVWDEGAEVSIALAPTPLERQPSAYVQRVWQERPRGEVSEVRVRAVCNDDALVLRLDWEESEPQRSISDVNVFADGCAVLFPANGKAADLDTMGSPQQPVAAWHWRAGSDDPFAVTAAGIGSVTRMASHPVKVNARWSEGRWRVAIGSPFAAGGVDLSGLASVPIAFAVWRGASSDRGGLKSYSPQFHQLRLRAAAQGDSP